MYRVKIEANKANCLPQDFADVSTYANNFVYEMDSLKTDLEDIDADLYSFTEAYENIEEVKDAEYSKRDAMISVSAAITDYFCEVARIDQSIEEMIQDEMNDFYHYEAKLFSRPISTYKYMLSDVFWQIVGIILVAIAAIFLFMLIAPELGAVYIAGLPKAFIKNFISMLYAKWFDIEKGDFEFNLREDLIDLIFTSLFYFAGPLDYLPATYVNDKIDIATGEKVKIDENEYNDEMMQKYIVWTVNLLLNAFLDCKYNTNYTELNDVLPSPTEVILPEVMEEVEKLEKDYQSLKEYIEGEWIKSGAEAGMALAQ